MARLTINGLLDDARARLDRLEPSDAFAAMEKGAIVIDTRSTDQRRETGVVPRSIHVPLSVLFWRLDPASASHDPRLAHLDARIVLLCAHGYSSSLAAATLRDLGFQGATDVVGGFAAWAAAGLPVEAAPISREAASPAS